jgi:short-subunit dehydrogenase
VQLEGSLCLVTGAASGIGLATATALAAAGARVVTADRPGTDADLHADLAEPGAAAALAAEAGNVDVLVNNAGVGLFGSVAELEPGAARRLLTIDLEAPIELTRALLPGMLARGRGHVVNVGSIVGFVGRPNEAVYAAGKAGLAVFTESLRSELRGRGVSASLVAPVVVETAFFAGRGAPYGRRRPKPVQPERVAAAIVDAVGRDCARVVVPGWLELAVRLHGAAPGAFRALADRFD